MRSSTVPHNLVGKTWGRRGKGIFCLSIGLDGRVGYVSISHQRFRWQGYGQTNFIFTLYEVRSTDTFDVSTTHAIWPHCAAAQFRRQCKHFRQHAGEVQSATGMLALLSSQKGNTILCPQFAVKGIVGVPRHPHRILYSYSRVLCTTSPLRRAQANFLAHSMFVLSPCACDCLPEQCHFRYWPHSRVLSTLLEMAQTRCD